MLNNHRLQLLRELRRRGTITRVAEALTYSTSAISQQLAQLEAEVGTSLIEPVGRKVRLTSAGELLADHAERILQGVEQAEAELAAVGREPSGILKVACFQTAALTFMPTVLSELAGRHPDLTIRLAEFQPDRAVPALLAHEFDLVLGEEYQGLELPRDEGIDQQDLLQDPMELATSRAPGDPAARLEDHADTPWVMESAGKPARLWAQSMCRRAGFEPEIRYESDDLVVHAALVASGHAVALLPRLLTSHRYADVATHALPTLPTRRLFTAVRTGSSARPAIRALRAALSRALLAQK